MAVKYEHPFQKIGTAFEKQSPHGLPPFESNYKITAPSREGAVSSVTFNNGIGLYNMHLKTGDTVKNLTIKTNEEPVFGFRFCLAGQKKLCMPGFKEDISILANHWEIFHFTDDHCYHKFRPNDRLQIVYLLVAPERSSLLMGNLAPLPSGDACQPFHLSRPITPDIRICLHRLLNCPYSGQAKNFYVEAKTMELMAHSLDRLSAGQQEAAPPLKPHDIERMHHAGSLLVKDLQHPPRPGDLARKTGVSRTKLFTAFRRVHGVPPSAYLRRARLEKARQLLKNREMNIAQIAAHLGFSCSGHFTRTFTQHFGVAPSRYGKMN